MGNANTSLSALNEYLFDQLDAITNPDLKGEELDEEIKRAKAVTDIAKNITKSADTQFKAIKLAYEMSGDTTNLNNTPFALPEKIEK